MHQDFSFGGERKTSKHKLEILSAQPLSNPNLLRYLAARAIPLPIAKAYCSEVLFQNMNRTYYAIGFCKRCFGMGNPQYVLQRMYRPEGYYND